MALMLFAGICPNRAANSVRMLPAFCLVALLFVVRIAVIGAVLHSSQQDINDLRTLGGALPPGGRVLATRLSPDEDRVKFYRDQPVGRQLRGLLPNIWFLPSLWVIERYVFLPLLFPNQPFDHWR
jgi:hypothetical protein